MAKTAELAPEGSGSSLKVRRCLDVTAPAPLGPRYDQCFGKGTLLSRSTILHLTVLGAILMIGYNNCARFVASSGSTERSSSAAAVVMEASIENTDDARPELQALIDRAAELGSSVIRLAPITYRLRCPNQKGSVCLNVTNVSNLKIEGTAGQTKLLVVGAVSGLLAIQSSRNVELNGLTVDFERLPFTQGRVTEVAGTSFTIAIDAGFDEPDAEQFATNLFDGNGMGVVFRGQTDEIKTDDMHVYAALAAQSPVRLAAGSWRIATYNANLSSFLAAGDRLTLAMRGTHLITSVQTTDLTIRNVTLNASSYMGIVTLGNRGTTTIDGLRVEPGAGRLLSLNADAIHVLESRARLIVRNSVFRHQGDDALNVKASSYKILAVSGTDLTLAHSSVDFEVGDRLQLVSPMGNQTQMASVTERLAGTYPSVTNVSADGEHLYVRLDRAVEGSVFVGDVAFDLNMASPYSLVTQNTYQDFRGSIRFRSYGGSFTENTFLDSRFAHVLLDVDSYWPEGPLGVHVIDAGGNVAPGGGPAFFGYDWMRMAQPASSAGLASTLITLPPDGGR